MEPYKTSRRTVLQITGVAVATALAGCGGDGDGGGNDTTGGQETEFIDEEPDYGGYLEDAKNYNGTVDLRGQEEVTVEVGAGDGLAFGPAAISVSQGTTVQWEWTGDGGKHNVQANEGPADLDSGSAVQATGVEYEYAFEATGTTTYFCDPHETIGMKGAVHVA
ncbi:MAG: halocyanin domain-containing protein [Halobacteriales archaeon]